MIRSKALLGGGAVAVAVATVAACGSSGASKAKGDPFTVVAAAADATAAAKNAAFTLDLKIDTTSSGEVTINGDGVEDLAAKKLRMTLKLAQDGTTQGEIKEIFAGGLFYVQVPEQSRSKTDGKAWVVVDPKKLVGSGASNSFNQDPTAVLATLKTVSSNVKEVGQEDIRGVHTTHYRADVDLQKAAAKQGADSAFVKNALQSFGNITLPEDVYIDDQGRARRVSFTISPQPGTKAADQLKSETLVMDIYDFGKADTSGIDAPPASDTIDASKVPGFNQALGG